MIRWLICGGKKNKEPEKKYKNTLLVRPRAINQSKAGVAPEAANPSVRWVLGIDEHGLRVDHLHNDGGGQRQL